jgi:hypothetical protein
MRSAGVTELHSGSQNGVAFARLWGDHGERRKREARARPAQSGLKCMIPKSGYRFSEKIMHKQSQKRFALACRRDSDLRGM